MPNILLIDDEAIVREPLSAILGAAGYSVSCAADGRAALSAVRSKAPDLILLDVRLGSADGLSVLRDFRAHATTRTIPVILLTGVSDKSVILEAAKLGVDGYVLKSTFSSSELLTRVQSALKSKDDGDGKPKPADSQLKNGKSAASPRLARR